MVLECFIIDDISSTKYFVLNLAGSVKLCSYFTTNLHTVITLIISCHYLNRLLKTKAILLAGAYFVVFKPRNHINFPAKATFKCVFRFLT